MILEEVYSLSLQRTEISKRQISSNNIIIITHFNINIQIHIKIKKSIIIITIIRKKNSIDSEKKQQLNREYRIIYKNDDDNEKEEEEKGNSIDK